MTTAQLIIQREAQYRDNQEVSNLLTIMKQINDSLDVALVRLEKLEASRLYVERGGA